MHMSDHYILPSELIILVLVWYIPPLILASSIEVFIFRKLGKWESNYKAFIGTIVLTFIISVLLGFFALKLDLPNWLYVSNNLFFSPIAFISVFLVSIIVIGCSQYVLHKNT